VLRELAPDVVLLQEAPRLLLWRLTRRRLCRRAGLVPVTTGRACGVVVLQTAHRRPVRHAYDVALPHHRGLHRRAVAVAVLDVDGVAVAFASTHLDLRADARLDSAGRVRDALPAGPLVLGADVNEPPGEPAWGLLGDGLVDARDGLGPTFPARDPHRWIDGLWVSPDLVVSRAEVVPAGTVSDHLPLLVELRA
jgi:endonuclease/exonuclease/phosphatase family metal-dependent hydrolase